MNEALKHENKGSRQIIEKQKPKKSQNDKFYKIVEKFIASVKVSKAVEITGLPKAKIVFFQSQVWL
jgi:hypothetical protein